MHHNCFALYITHRVLRPTSCPVVVHSHCLHSLELYCRQLPLTHATNVIRASITSPMRQWGHDPELLQEQSSAQQLRQKHAVQETESLGIKVFSFDAFAKLGQEKPSDPIPPKPEDLCTIMYTSGTTDKPKVGITQCSALHAAQPLSVLHSCITQLSMTMCAVCHTGCTCPSTSPAQQDWPVSCYGASKVAQVHSRRL